MVNDARLAKGKKPVGFINPTVSILVAVEATLDYRISCL